jgi:hypothetical protein
LERRFPSRLFCGFTGLASDPGGVALCDPAIASNFDGLPGRPASPGSYAASRCLSNAAFFAAAAALWRSAKLVSFDLFIFILPVETGFARP